MLYSPHAISNHQNHTRRAKKTCSKMTLLHIQTQNTWHKLSLAEQLANIGAEAGRAMNWKEKNTQMSRNAFNRALELFDFTIDDPKNRTRLSEILRARELFADYFIGENQYNSTQEEWNKYFFYFNLLARKATG